MKEYEPLIKERHEPIEANEPWYWIESDQGGWSGPKGDWINQHSQRYFDKVKKFDLCIQAGGNCGMYPRLLATRFKQVYTFEPDALNFHCLVNNCQLDNVIKINAALGDDHRMIHIKRESMGNVGAHRIRRGDPGMIPQLKIDDFIFPECDMICLDVEDYEIYVLKGAVNTITKYKPVIAAENGNEEVDAFLFQFGYKRIINSGADTVYAVE